MFNIFKKKSAPQKPALYPLDPNRITGVVIDSSSPYVKVTLKYAYDRTMSLEEFLDKKIEERLAKLK